MERWLQTEWPDLKVYLTSVTDQWSVMSVAGPYARTVLKSAGCDLDLDGDNFPFMSTRAGQVARIPARVSRISFSGELAFEISVDANHGLALWEAIMTAGRDYDITPYGTEAMHVLRAEKGYVIVGQDTDGSVTPVDLGMDWIVSKKKDFIGKQALEKRHAQGPIRQLVSLKVDSKIAPAYGGASIMDSDRVVGTISSGEWGHRVNMNLAYAFVEPKHTTVGNKLMLDHLGEMVAVEVIESGPYDPTYNKILS